MASNLLPSRFAALEPFAEKWAIGDIDERYRRRETSSMPELTSFYEAVVPRGEEILEHLQDFPMDDLPDAERNLMWLMASLSAVSFAVDVFRQPVVPETCGARMDWKETPFP